MTRLETHSHIEKEEVDFLLLIFINVWELEASTG
jgi:hypothetical protein